MATLGYTVNGGSELAMALNEAMAAKVVLAVAGDVTTLSFASDNTTGHVKGLIYSHDGASPGVPLTLLATAPATAITGDGVTPVWWTLTFSAPVSLVAGTYWLAVVADGSMTGRYDQPIASTVLDYQAANNYATPLTTWTPGTSLDQYAFSLYATYTATTATSALEWKAPAVQLQNHAVTSIVNMRATASRLVPALTTQGAAVSQPIVTDVQLQPQFLARAAFLRATSPMPVPYLLTTPTRVTNPLDWVLVTPDVIWTDG